MSRSDSKPDEPVTRDAIEAALRDLQADIDDRTPPMLVKVAYGAAAAATALIVFAYLYGRRVGRLRRTVVEITRI